MLFIGALLFFVAEKLFFIDLLRQNINVESSIIIINSVLGERDGNYNLC